MSPVICAAIGRGKLLHLYPLDANPFVPLYHFSSTTFHKEEINLIYNGVNRFDYICTANGWVIVLARVF